MRRLCARTLSLRGFLLQNQEPAHRHCVVQTASQRHHDLHITPLRMLRRLCCFGAREMSLLSARTQPALRIGLMAFAWRLLHVSLREILDLS